MNSKLDNEMKTGPLGLGAVVGEGTGLASKLPDGIGGALIGGANASGGSLGGLALTATGINQSSEKYKSLAIQTIGQHIDRRIIELREQLSTLHATRDRLDHIRALHLPVQTLRDALF